MLFEMFNQGKYILVFFYSFEKLKAALTNLKIKLSATTEEVEPIKMSNFNNRKERELKKVEKLLVS